MIENGRIVSVNYFPGAGGNFVQNCLGLSRHCVLRDQKYVNWQLTATVNTDFYQQKLAWVLDTVPSVIDHNWINYELGSHRMIGFRMSNHTVSQHMPIAIHQAAEQGLWVTQGAHSYSQTEYLTQVWPQVQYVNVLGKTWAQQWGKIKKNRSIFGNKEIHAVPSSYAEWQASPGAYEFDLDAVVHSESDFLLAIQNLYDWLGWDDFDQAPVIEYYRAYYSAHDQQFVL
jgi:hypothetical protein